MNTDAGEKTGRELPHGLFLASLAWPWGAYQHLYGSFGLFSVATLALFLAFVRSWIGNGRPAIPFDLFWPLGLMLSCAAGAFLATGSAVAQGLFWGVLAFVVALGSSVSPAAVCQALGLSVVSAGAVALLTVGSEFNYVFPTFFSATAGTVGAGPVSLADALAMFSWCACVGVILACDHRYMTRGVRCFVIAPAVLSCALSGILLLRRVLSVAPVLEPQFSMLSFPALPFALLCLYLAARAAARVVVVARYCRARVPAFLALAMAGAAVACAFLGAPPSAGLCFSLGLVAGLGIFNRFQVAKWKRPLFPFLIVAPVIAAHFFVLFPGDVRDYALQTNQWVDAGQPLAAARHLRRILARYPGEGTARLLLARIELTAGQLHAAADNFCLVARDRRASRGLPPPSEEMQNRFVEALRTEPAVEGGVTYERCLVALGREQEALSHLRGRVQGAGVTNFSAEPLSRALAAVLGIGHGDGALTRWTPAEVIGALRLCGPYTQSIQAPAGLPRHFLPAVLAARPVRGGRAVAVFVPQGQYGRTWSMPPCAPESGVAGESVWLDPERDEETGEWFVSLAGVAEVRLRGTPRVSLTEDPALDCCPGAGPWSIMCLLP